MTGNDLANFSVIAHPKDIAKESRKLCYNFVDAFVSFPKPLIAGVNGPAIGIAVTTLGLVDAVYASDTATFRTPFRELGQAPEGCSSYMFPKIMGEEMAHNVLDKSILLTAEDAKKCGFVTEIYPANQLRQ
eukprot:Colp12_sorted_trinity150504_noHs@33235